jgi:hypothetical protein
MKSENILNDLMEFCDNMTISNESFFDIINKEDEEVTEVKESYNFFDMINDDVAMEGVQIDSFKIYISKDMKACKQKYREGKKLLKTEPDEAIKCFNESIDAANELKRRVHEIKDGSKRYRLLSLFNPLLVLVKNEETTGIIPVGNTIVRTYNVYDDSMSKSAKNAMQEQIQQALNLHIRNCKYYIDYTEDNAKLKLKKLKMKNKKKR